MSVGMVGRLEGVGLKDSWRSLWKSSEPLV